MTETEIIEKIGKNDPSVMKWIYQNYYVGLCTYAHRFIKNKSTSEELVQQSLFKFWEKRESLQINTTLAGYLFSMVRNNCLNYIKHQQIELKYSENYLKSLKDSEDLMLMSQETGLSIYIARELENKITTAIENLPEQCREIFKMSRFEGLKHFEIAEKKNITINTVQKQISIALGKLKTELSAYLSVAIMLYVRFLNFF